jgi:Domain of unknown function (DUF4347)/FG-GAP-like repeat
MGHFLKHTLLLPLIMMKSTPLLTKPSQIVSVDSEAIMLTEQRFATQVVSANTLVVFDDRIQDIDILYQALLPGAIGIILNSHSDALVIITELLAETGAKHLSIVAHGESGVIHLGKNLIDIKHLQLQSHLLKQWKVTGISLYSCEVAKGAVGERFIYQLSELTDSTVAASATKTGHSILGGSWVLAVTTDEIAAPMPFEVSIIQTYQAILPVITVLPGTDPIEGGVFSTFDFNLDSPAPVGGLVVSFATSTSTAMRNIDYTLSAGTGITALTANTFTIAAGATSATIKVLAIQDAVIDPNETVTINITPGVGYTKGFFAATINFFTNRLSGRSVDVGDFNGDGNLDFAALGDTVGTGSISVYLGNGFGQFALPVKTSWSYGAFFEGTGDFNGDGKTDLFVNSRTSLSGPRSLSVLLANGVGGFSVGGVDATGIPFAIGDVNNDGKSDIVSTGYYTGDVASPTNYNFNNRVRVLFGNNSGSLTNPLYSPLYSVGFRGYSGELGDFNGDNKLDLFGAVQGGQIVVQLGDGLGTFDAPISTAVESSLTSIVAGDFNGDNKLDLVGKNGSNVSVLLGNGSGGFAAPINTSTIVDHFSVGDFNSDNKLDLAGKNGSNVLVLLGDGLGGFAPPINNPVNDVLVSSSFNLYKVADLNRDGRPDLIAIADVVNNSAVSFLLNNAANLTIIDNSAPTDLSLNVNRINENVAANTIIGDFSSSDPDTSDTFTYSLVNGTGGVDNSTFTVNGNQLIINASPDFETKSSYSIRVRTSDRGGLFLDKSLNINVNNLNESPTDLNLSSNNVNENVIANTIIGNFSSSDPDTSDTFTYNLVNGIGGTDNSAFTINGNQLRINASPNFETKSSYGILVGSTDQGGLFLDKQLTVNINNVNEAPTDLSLSANSINENVAANSVVGNFNSSDPDIGDTFTYSLVNGIGAIDNSVFIVSGNQLKINVFPDFETKSSYGIRVRTSDQNGLFFDKSLTININNLNDAPTDLSLSASSINENVAANSVVGNFGTTDPDAGSTIFTYSLVGGAGATDNSAFTINGSQLSINGSPDFETKPSYSIRVRTTDQGGLFFDKALNININDLDEFTNSNELSDFNGDNKSDILWRNTNGSIAIWQMNGFNLASAGIISTVDSSWKIASSGDFNGDSKSDILWRNTDGSVAIWQMDGLNIVSAGIIARLDNSWKIAGTGDFNGDNKSDILWRNNDGSTALWQMNGFSLLSGSYLGLSTDNTWKIAGTGDFNGDSKADILWRKNDGSTGLWQMNGASVLSASLLSLSTDNTWKISGTGDFNGDNKADILWRKNDGSTGLWQMDGVNVFSASLLSLSTDNTWKIFGTGNFNGDNKADILWRKNDGSTGLWQMHGANVLSAGLLGGTADNSWQIAVPSL